MKLEVTRIFKLPEKDNKLNLKVNMRNSFINFISILSEMITTAAQYCRIRKGSIETGMIDKNEIDAQILIRY